MNPEQVYQSVHDRWKAYSSGDFSTNPGEPCAFCDFAFSAMEPGALDKCNFCPALHALGTSCYDHPVMMKFQESGQSASIAIDVLELLESIEDVVIAYMEEKLHE